MRYQQCKSDRFLCYCRSLPIDQVPYVYCFLENVIIDQHVICKWMCWHWFLSRIQHEIIWQGRWSLGYQGISRNSWGIHSSSIHSVDNVATNQQSPTLSAVGHLRIECRWRRRRRLVVVLSVAGLLSETWVHRIRLISFSYFSSWRAVIECWDESARKCTSTSSTKAFSIGCTIFDCFDLSERLHLSNEIWEKFLVLDQKSKRHFRLYQLINSIDGFFFSFQLT